MQWLSFHIHWHIRNKVEDSARKSMQAPNGPAKESKKSGQEEYIRQNLEASQHIIFSISNGRRM